MAESGAENVKPRKRMRWILAPLAARPRLAIAMIIGLVVGIGLGLFAPLRPTTAGVLGWDATCLAFALATLPAMAGKEPRHIAKIAVDQDVGRGFILGLVIAAAVASIAAVGFELSVARKTAGVTKALHVAVPVATVAASWFMVHLIFALHYAHDFYAADNHTRLGVRGGLKFPGGAEPDYWDFLHFSLVIGVASQTADVAFTSRALRRVGTLHCVLAFTFNTAILALTINLVAGLF